MVIGCEKQMNKLKHEVEMRIIVQIILPNISKKIK